MTNIQSGQLDLIRDDCDRAFGVSDAESVGERAMRKTNDRPSFGCWGEVL